MNTTTDLEEALAPLQVSSSISLTGEAPSHSFGDAVATAGDVNGDGYADVVVGAPFYNGNTGRVYLYFGSATGLDVTPVFTATGEGASDNFGIAVGAAGDVNADGYADVIIGARGYNASTGRVYVYHGSASGLGATPAFTATGEVTPSSFGYAVGTAGDVNGDSYADVIVGASGYSSGMGRVYVYTGTVNGLSPTPAFTATGEATTNSFGISVDTAGDVNDDGYADIVIGAWAYNFGTGRAYVYHGSAAGLSATPAFTATGATMGDAFGRSAETAGDVNGDGYADVVIGAWGSNSNTGQVYVYHGSAAGLSVTPAFTATGETSENYFGLSAGTAGDVNGDSYADVVVGAWRYDSDRGRAYIYLGSAAGLSNTPTFTATGEALGNHLGISVGTAGDVNMDGYADVIVGARGYNSNTGRAYLYAGPLSALFDLFLPLVTR